MKSECERGVWYPVACSKQIALKQVIQLPKPLWREVSELVGGMWGTKAGRRTARLRRRTRKSTGTATTNEKLCNRQRQEEVYSAEVQKRV